MILAGTRPCDKCGHAHPSRQPTLGRSYRFERCGCGCTHREGDVVVDTDVDDPDSLTTELLFAAHAAASYERDDLGSPWCGVCHRTVFDCDKEPEKHSGGDHEHQDLGHAYRPDEKFCPGYRIRAVLRKADT